VTRYYVGLDLGQAQDYTALSVIDAPPQESGPSPLHIVHLHRYQLGMTYPDIIADVQRVLSRIPGARLAVDATGVGRPVVDLLRKERLQPIAITITGGDKAIHEGSNWRVPKRDLVGLLAVAFQNKRLKIAASLPHAKTLIDELLNFKVKVSAAGHDSYEAWREGDHDDLVLSVAMACFAESKYGPVRSAALTSRPLPGAKTYR
jgi:hypothetical protein